MATWFCSKTRADCDKQIAALTKELNDYKAWAAMLQADRDKKAAALSSDEAMINDHYKFMAAGLPSMEEMIKDGRAKYFDVYQFQRQYTKQTGLTLSTSSPTSDKTKTLWVECGYYRYRLPKDIFMKIVAKSRVNHFKYTVPTSDPMVRPYICNDFAWSLYCEFNMGPWWDVFIGCALLGSRGHRMNVVWFSDAEELILLEPQADIFSPVVDVKSDIVYLAT